MRRLFLPLILASAAPSLAQAPGKPVIDMHLHAFRLDFAEGAEVCPGSQHTIFPAIDPRAEFDPAKMMICAHPFRAPGSDAELMQLSLTALVRYNIRRAVTSGDMLDVAAWRSAMPDRIIPAVGFARSTEMPLDELRRLAVTRQVAVFAEVGTQYRGIPADDPRWEPYFALAEELDVPVGIHLGEGPPAAARFPGYEDYRASVTTPFQLENVLRRHPKLRIYAMHYGSPLVDEMIAMLFTHPNLYVDVACNDWLNPRAQFYDHLKWLVDAGFEQRILFGSDQMLWPQAIGEAIASIEAAPFLSAKQKRAIFYDNAARFLRLTPEEIAKDHRN